MDSDGGLGRPRDHGREPASPAAPGALEGARRARAVSRSGNRGRRGMSLFTRELACQELVQLVTAYFDGSLSRRDRRRFRAHIRGCEHCTTYVEQMRVTIEATGRLTEDDIEPEAREDLLEAFRGWREGR